MIGHSHTKLLGEIFNSELSGSDKELQSNSLTITVKKQETSCFHRLTKSSLRSYTRNVSKTQKQALTSTLVAVYDYTVNDDVLTHVVTPLLIMS